MIPFKQHFFSTYNAPRTVLGPEDTNMNQAQLLSLRLSQSYRVTDISHLNITGWVTLLLAT